MKKATKNILSHNLDLEGQIVALNLLYGCW